MSKEAEEWQDYIEGCQSVIAATRSIANSILDKRSREIVYPESSKWLTRLWWRVVDPDITTRMRYFDSREDEVFGNVMRSAIHEDRVIPNIRVVEREWKRKRPSVTVYLLADSRVLNDFVIDAESNNPFHSHGSCTCFWHELAGPMNLADFMRTGCGWDSLIIATACMDSVDHYLDIYNKWR